MPLTNENPHTPSPASSQRRIVICCDGTWNTPDAQKDGIPAPTNVARIARAIQNDSRGVRQITYYNPGVGALGSKPYRVLAGATGLGLSANLLDAYAFLIRTYRPGDELFLFGFSRGAFTVRSLAGLINNSGILLPEHASLIQRAFCIYRSRNPQFHPRQQEATLFRKTYAWHDRTPIKFIGVWDTVGALGNPLLLSRGPLSRRFRFHDTCLSSTVENACQALAIDEKRRHFKATLWQKDPKTAQHLEQRWFVGVHANIGGGYAASGFSDIALMWMADKAAQWLGIDRDILAASHNTERRLEESRTGLYRLFPPYHRPINHPDNWTVRRAGGEGPVWETNESIDDSVLAHIDADPTYRPPALLRYLEQRSPAAVPEAVTPT